jgi:hypothetical protein
MPAPAWGQSSEPTEMPSHPAPEGSDPMRQGSDPSHLGSVRKLMVSEPTRQPCDPNRVLSEPAAQGSELSDQPDEGCELPPPGIRQASAGKKPALSGLPPGCGRQKLVVVRLRPRVGGLTKCHHELRPTLRTSDFWTRKTGRSPRNPFPSLSYAAGWLRMSQDSQRETALEPGQAAASPAGTAGRGPNPFFSPRKAVSSPSQAGARVLNLGCEPTEPKTQGSEPKSQGSEPKTQSSDPTAGTTRSCGVQILDKHHHSRSSERNASGTGVLSPGRNSAASNSRTRASVPDLADFES